MNRSKTLIKGQMSQMLPGFQVIECESVIKGEEKCTKKARFLNPEEWEREDEVRTSYYAQKRISSSTYHLVNPYCREILDRLKHNDILNEYRDIIAIKANSCEKAYVCEGEEKVLLLNIAISKTGFNVSDQCVSRERLYKEIPLVYMSGAKQYLYKDYGFNDLPDSKYTKAFVAAIITKCLEAMGDWYLYSVCKYRDEYKVSFAYKTVQKPVYKNW